MNIKIFSVIFLLLCFSIGCGNSSPSGETSSEQAVHTENELKTQLEYIAKSGDTGSVLAGMPQVIEKIPDENKKASLMEDFHKLENSNSSAAKSVAKSMLQKLE